MTTLNKLRNKALLEVAKYDFLLKEFPIAKFIEETYCDNCDDYHKHLCLFDENSEPIYHDIEFSASNSINKANQHSFVDDGDRLLYLPIYSGKFKFNKTVKKINILCVKQPIVIAQTNFDDKILNYKNPKIPEETFNLIENDLMLNLVNFIKSFDLITLNVKNMPERLKKISAFM